MMLHAGPFARLFFRSNLTLVPFAEHTKKSHRLYRQDRKALNVPHNDTLAGWMLFLQRDNLLTGASVRAPMIIVDKIKVQSRIHVAKYYSAIVCFAQSCHILLTTQATEC